jgi:hypothetical protein
LGEEMEKRTKGKNMKKKREIDTIREGIIKEYMERHEIIRNELNKWILNKLMKVQEEDIEIWREKFIQPKTEEIFMSTEFVYKENTQEEWNYRKFIDNS